MGVAGPFGDEAARAVAREQMALSTASDQLGAIAESARPMARDDSLTVASREDGPEALIEPSPSRSLSLAAIDALPPASGDEQWQCLAQAIYFESRGEPLAGQVAVAEVVLNRTSSRSFPGTICGVVHQGVGSGRGCQFSYACDGLPDVMKSALARERSEKLARLMIDGQPRTISGGATYFHVRSIRPDWSRRFTRTVTIGQHMFYRPATQVAGG
ncbi:MAG: cell wall hydrolase [Amaricoccus sp.]|uniref:cell wall hydrolase n=1 Tax=Amaricoccus sp. TaxID=1872485 RepID=UPI0039E43316